MLTASNHTRQSLCVPLSRTHLHPVCAQPLVHVTHQSTDQVVSCWADFDFFGKLEKQPPVDNLAAGCERVVAEEWRVACCWCVDWFWVLSGSRKRVQHTHTHTQHNPLGVRKESA